jgi:microcystin degradation protein MlrC
MAPWSLQQLRHCGLEPADFTILVAKGVHAPLAAYREVCEQLIRVNTAGVTSADLNTFDFRHRRRPMFPFEADANWSVETPTQPAREVTA